MADKLRDQEGHDYVIKRILGHATQSETHDRYGSNKNVSLAAESINRIKYGWSGSDHNQSLTYQDGSGYEAWIIGYSQGSHMQCLSLSLQMPLSRGYSTIEL